MTETSAKPSAYLINNDRFDALAKKQYGTIGKFCESSGIRYRTMLGIRAHRGEPTLTNVRKILDAFPGVAFEHLFYANPATSNEVDEYADLQIRTRPIARAAHLVRPRIAA